MLMLMEQMFNSHHIKLAKNEKIMNKSYNNQIYMYYFMFANAEYLVSIKKQAEGRFMENIDEEDDIREYYTLLYSLKT